MVLVYFLPRHLSEQLGLKTEFQDAFNLKKKIKIIRCELKDTRLRRVIVVLANISTNLLSQVLSKNTSHLLRHQKRFRYCNILTGFLLLLGGLPAVQNKILTIYPHFMRISVSSVLSRCPLLP